MSGIKGLILCEGETDQVLISSFLEQTEGWRHFKHENPPFPRERVEWYKKQGDKLLGVWQVGGNDFANALKEILKREKLDAGIERVVVVTDHDDDSADTVRLNKVFHTVCSELAIGFNPGDYSVGAWFPFSVEGSFEVGHVDIAYLLVPKNEAGALETFMLDALAGQDDSKREVVEQAREFVAGFESDVYLKRRRERVKAELGVSLAVFSPDRAFMTMEELIDSVAWGDYELSNKQFSLLREIG